jgi:hypothetical protein
VKKFHSIALISGLILFSFLIWKIGPGDLWRQLATLGWGLLPMILMNGATKFLHAVGWRYCLYGPHRSLPFLQVLMIRMAGFSINQLTPTATIGGDVSMGALLAMANPGTEAVGSAMIGKLSHALAQLIFAVIGSIFILLGLSLPEGGWWAMITGSCLLGAGIAGFFIFLKYGIFGASLRWMVSRGYGGKTIEKAASKITQVDEETKRYYQTNNIDFLLSIFWNVLALAGGILQTWFFFHFTDIKTTWLIVAAVWFLATWFEIASFAIPSNVGILEGTSVIVLKIAGFSSALGLAYGIALRVGQLFWTAIGLVCYLILVRRWGRKT